MADVLTAPKHLWIPKYDHERTLGPEVAAVATLAGFPPDPEQRMLLDAAFALDKRGKSVAFEVVVIAPRQNLKTGLFKQIALGDLFVRDERLVVWSAHEFDTAQEALTDIESLIDGSDLLRKRVKITSRGSSAKHGAVPEIEMLTGARLKFKTRTSGGGRGLSGRKVFLDEGYALQPAQSGALYPIMLAQPDPQVRIGSSACRPESAVLWEIVQRGRASAALAATGGGEPRMVYAEWCAESPKTACGAGEHCDHSRNARNCGCDKPEVIATAHSAIARGRIKLQTIIDLRRTMPAAEYGREIMGWHDEVTDEVERINVEAWEALAEPKMGAPERCGWALDVSPDRLHASISAAGPVGARTLLFVVESDVGTSWIVPALLRLKASKGLKTISIDGASPAASLIPSIEKDRAGNLTGITVLPTTNADMAKACGSLFDAVQSGEAAHLGDPLLLDALRSAGTRPIGDGGWGWMRKGSANITPLVSVTLALAASHNLALPAPFALWGK
jgi:hypothetical protein